MQLTNPNFGARKLNEAKSTIPAGTGKNTTVVYEAAGDHTKVTADGVDGSGKPTHSGWTGKFDGKPYPVTRTRGVDSRAVMAKGDRTLEITNMKGGKPVSKGKVELAKDGKSRTPDIDGASADGKKYKAKYGYDKQSWVRSFKVSCQASPLRGGAFFCVRTKGRQIFVLTPLLFSMVWPQVVRILLIFNMVIVIHFCHKDL